MRTDNLLVIVAWAAAATMVLTMVPDASWVGLGAAAVATMVVVLAQWRRWAATVAVQIVAVGLAVDGTSAVLAALAGLAATAFLLATHLGSTPELLAPVVQRLLPAVGVTTLVALAAALVPTGPGWLAALAPLASVSLYASCTARFRTMPRQ